MQGPGDHLLGIKPRSRDAQFLTLRLMNPTYPPHLGSIALNERGHQYDVLYMSLLRCGGDRDVSSTRG